MCLAKLILKEMDSETVLLDNVCTVDLDGPQIIAVNLFGKTIETSGTIVRIDLIDSHIVIAK